MKLGALAVLCAVIATASVAHAGFKYTQPVWIDFEKQQAGGQMGAARASADDNSAIAIWVYVIDGDDEVIASVSFTDAKGHQLECHTSFPPMVHALEAVPSDAFIQVTWGDSKDGGGKACKRLEYYNGSFNPPKQP
jgi:hypothetical protein